MFRACASLRIKLTTGLTGYPIIPDAREQLIHRYRLILGKLNTSTIPKDTVYRQRVEKLASRNLSILLHSDLNDDQCEEKINMGQLEELIQLARNEEGLIGDMEKWRPWEVKAGHQIKFVDEDVPRDKALVEKLQNLISADSAPSAKPEAVHVEQAKQ
eukprot:TRINITY_DN1446_c0_g1::TRINITY_DN1446_c0_g1_i1::g.27114::m.27114 TRINITY_DN1446_c0_g1::TRINITY_DN1446_c0_g1_i1::g.27114  ORF type:complete len:158 (-),score=8.43,sp/Q9FLX7/NDUA5_ARATH/33.62/2e-15,ETC_C1_NDUFA5/PF04716.9/3.7e-08,ETC_C1_NDUFA5/PF04716.9/3.8e+03 TRINITY_DN1446_c0_g1_i1:191-664(-)